MNALYLIIALFALGAIIGMFLLSQVLQDKATSKGAAAVHGLFVVAALVLLIKYASNNGPGLTEAIIVFVVAALGGLVMIIRDIGGRSVPKWLAIFHGLTAVVGFVILLAFAFGG